MEGIFFKKGENELIDTLLQVFSTLFSFLVSMEIVTHKTRKEKEQTVDKLTKFEKCIVFLAVWALLLCTFQSIVNFIGL